MTELERWLKKYGKAKTVATGKQGNVNNKTTNNNVNTTKKKDVNARIKEKMDKFRLSCETPEQRIKRKMEDVPADYHPGVHTKNMTLPIYRSQNYINAKIKSILNRGGEILDIKTEPTSMFGFQTMYILIVYRMPDWDVLLDYV